MDILSMSQEDVVLTLIKNVTGIGFLEKDQVDFEYKINTIDLLDSTVDVTLTARVNTPLGVPGKWSGNKTISVKRAKFKERGNLSTLRIPHRDGMAIEHVLKRLLIFHNLNVSNAELEYLISPMTTYADLPESMVVKPGKIMCRFKIDNLRFDHRNSEFEIELYQDIRQDLGQIINVNQLGNSLSATPI